jgi:uncharacterized short protein YbdD (DUF466 family)
MGTRLIGLLRDSIHPRRVGRWVPGCFAGTLPLAGLRGDRHPHVSHTFRWLRSVRLALKPFATAPELCKRGWKAIRELSGDNGYERYLAHHAATHPDIPPLSREAWFAERQQHKWTGVKRCC